MRSGTGQPISALAVDPHTIRDRRACAPGVELVTRRRQPGSVELPRGHAEHVLMCTTGHAVRGRSSRSVLETQEQRRVWRRCPRGQVSFIPAGLPLTWEWSYDSSSIHLCLSSEFLQDTARQISGPAGRGEDLPLAAVFRAADPSLNFLLRSLAQERTGETLGADLVTSSLLNLIAVHVLRLAGAPASACAAAGSGVAPPDGRAAGEHSRLATRPAASCAMSPESTRRSIELLTDRLGENVTIAELAAQAQLSPWHFARQFKQATGLPPHRWQLALRIDRARDLLRQQPSRSIAEIASQLGFADESHFRRHFKRRVGITPSDYRSRQQ